jgi:hypothetical protein
MAAPALSGILTFIAGVLAVVGNQPPLAGTSTGVFVEAFAVFLGAVTVYLVQQGIITFVRETLAHK